MRCRHRSSDGAKRAAGQCTYTGAVPAANGPTYSGTCARTDRCSTERTLPWIIGIGASRQRQYDAERCGSKFG